MGAQGLTPPLSLLLLLLSALGLSPLLPSLAYFLSSSALLSLPLLISLLCLLSLASSSPKS